MTRRLYGIAGACVLWMLGASGAPAQVFRSSIDLVRVHATVADAEGRLVTSLERGDFEILDNGQPQAIAVFANSPQPLRLVLLLDVSGSMAGNLELLKSGAEHLFTRLRPDDAVRVGTFGQEVIIAPRFTNDIAELRAMLPTSTPFGPTPLWLAVDEAMRAFDTGGDARRVIVVLSDGDDSISSSPASPRPTSLADIVGRAQRNGVMVYGVGMRSSGPAGQLGPEPAPGLWAVAWETGGGYTQVENGQDLGAEFARIADELHGQYLLGFEPPAHDGQVHRIEVRLRRSELTARARRSYVASRGPDESRAEPPDVLPFSGHLTLFPVGRGGRGGPSNFSSVPARVRAFAAWLDAVERHQPGVSDAPLQLVRSMNDAVLHQAWTHVASVISLIRRPDTRSFSTPALAGSIRAPRTRPAEPSQSIAYTPEELSWLRATAAEIARQGSPRRLLTRGAMLHADAAILPAAASAGRAGAARGASARTVVQIVDGQTETSTTSTMFHWEMGRRLLELTGPERTPGSGLTVEPDTTVRLWYTATTSFMQRIAQLVPWHVERSLQLFPRDPDTLFLAGCFHEALSAQELQMAMQSMDRQQQRAFDVRDEQDELSEAERLFRRVLEVDPAYAEARLHLGRVLARLGRHEPAARELREVAKATRDPLTLYFARLFLGAEAVALGDASEARDAYQAAAALYPHAQSPRLALSALAARAGDAVEAMRLMQPVLDPAVTPANSDPWWSYARTQARFTDLLVAQLHAAIERER